MVISFQKNSGDLSNILIHNLRKALTLDALVTMIAINSTICLSNFTFIFMGNDTN